MKKTLRIACLFAVSAAVAVVAAQSASQGASEATYTQAAAPSGNGSESNSVISVLRNYFSNRQQVEGERARAAGYPATADAYIKVSCAAFLATMTPAEQKREVNEVWQLSKWQAGDPGWAAVTKTPSMVNALLKIDKPVADKVAAYTDRQWNEFLRPYRQIENRLMQTTAWKNASDQTARNQLHYAAMQEYHADKPLFQRQLAALARAEKAITYTASQLTPAQRKEFNTILQRFETSMRTASSSAGYAMK